MSNGCMYVITAVISYMLQPHNCPPSFFSVFRTYNYHAMPCLRYAVCSSITSRYCFETIGRVEPVLGIEAFFTYPILCC